MHKFVHFDYTKSTNVYVSLEYKFEFNWPWLIFNQYARYDVC